MRQAKRAVGLVGVCLALSGRASEVPAQTFIGGQRPECGVETSVGESHPTTKTGYIDEIANVTRAGEDFRRVLYTGGNLQLTIMALPPGEDIGRETRMGHDLFVRIEAGQGQVSIDGRVVDVNENSGIIIPAGAMYTIVNTGGTPMRLYIIYGSPEFASNSVRATKSEANSSPDAFDGCTTE